MNHELVLFNSKLPYVCFWHLPRLVFLQCHFCDTKPHCILAGLPWGWCARYQHCSLSTWNTQILLCLWVSWYYKHINCGMIVEKETIFVHTWLYCLQSTAKVKNVNSSSSELFNLFPIKQHLSVAVVFWTWMWIMPKHVFVARGCLIIFVFFFLVFFDVGKCNPIALILNDLCNEFWVIFPVFDDPKCWGQNGQTCFHGFRGGSQKLQSTFQIDNMKHIAM